MSGKGMGHLLSSQVRQLASLAPAIIMAGNYVALLLIILFA